MTILAQQFREQIIAPVLTRAGLWSQSAENLVLGTAAHESGNFRFIRQHPRGPARSFYQIEPATAADICRRFLADRPTLATTVAKACWPHLAQPPMFKGLGQVDINRLLIEDWAFATLLCRLKYYMAKPPLPEPDDIPGMASYWGRHYQTDDNPVKNAQWAQSYSLTVKEKRK